MNEKEKKQMRPSTMYQKTAKTKGKVIIVSGKRKSAIARAVLKEGSGRVKINNLLLDNYSSELYRMRIKEPLLLAGEDSKKVDIFVNVKGGGVSSQAEAIRLCIGKAMAEYNPSLKEVFLNYDRHLLVADVRRKETHKPNKMGKARAKKPKGKR